jgi:hypothetical protein
MEGKSDHVSRSLPPPGPERPRFCIRHFYTTRAWPMLTQRLYKVTPVKAVIIHTDFIPV